jgi:outer membrane protein OmpA-like peptidoglycan-associated protein
MKIIFFTPLLAGIVLFVSCRTAKKAQFNVVLQSAAEQGKIEAELIGLLAKKKDIKLAEGTIDDSIGYYIDQRLIKYQRRIDSLHNVINTLKAKIDNKKTFRKEFKVIQTRIILLDSFTKNKQPREYVFYMIDEGLDKSNRTLFEMAVFFGPGEYIIPEEKYSLAKEYFSPVIDSLMKFSNKFSAVNRTASIVLNGYADATGIGEGSNLYNLLLSRLNKTTATKEELNAALSDLRAENLRVFLNRLINERKNDFINLSAVAFENIRRGMGEKLPDPKITDYTIDDARRRIVLCYWSVLPDD